MRHHHDISPRDLWNYVLTKWDITTKLSWNYILTISKSCSSNQHKSSYIRISMSTFITNHPILVTCQDHAKLINQAHTIRDFMHIHIFHTLKGTNQVNHAIKHCSYRNIQSSKHTVVNLAQASSSRSGERDPSLKLTTLTLASFRAVGTSTSRSS